MVITHSMTLARQADLVVVLHEGRIVEAGEPAVLLSSGAEFRHLVTAQLHLDDGDGGQRARREDTHAARARGHATAGRP